MRYLGLLENIRVRRAGYAYRHTYEKFFYRYRVCSPKTWPNWTGDVQSGTRLLHPTTIFHATCMHFAVVAGARAHVSRGCVAILESLHLEAGEWQKGATKIFVRHPETVFNLEELRERKVATFANRIQRFLGIPTLLLYFSRTHCARARAPPGRWRRV